MISSKFVNNKLPLNHNHSPKSSQEYSNKAALNDLTILKELGASKATVYLAHAASLNQFVAVKTFLFEQRRLNRFFLNEVKYTHLQHPHIISSFGCSKKQQIALSQDLSTNVSLIIMELAPYGDFYSLLVTKQIPFDTKLARTYFRQLVSAMECMHSQNIAHQDLKLENLLLGDGFDLKVADFDVAWTEGQSIIKNVGTQFYRAPEMCNKTCKDPRAADIYSAGVVLFMFMCGGKLPHLEDQLYNGENLRSLLENNNEAFWEKHSEIQERDESFFDESFKQLFNGMMCTDASRRYTLEEIKSSKWYQGEIYSNDEVALIMTQLFE